MRPWWGSMAVGALAVVLLPLFLLVEAGVWLSRRLR